MILTTTNSIQGKEITQYLGIVTTTIYVRYHKSKMSFKDAFNLEKSYENAEEGLEIGKQAAFEKLKEKGKELQATAIIGISMDVEITRDGMTRAISVMGTAVNFK